MSKERPILFGGPMVRAILDGRKTQTRRLLVPRHSWSMGESDDGQPWPFFDSYVYAEPDDVPVPCPYGAPGDRLWVRETWATGAAIDHLSPVQVGERALDAGYPQPWAPLMFRATGSTSSSDALSSFGHAWGKWRSSIHMPRWASRLTLEITDVRVQRLQDIVEDDARAEGVAPAPFCKAGRPEGLNHIESFEDLWGSINAKRAPWSANPWVWAVTFVRVDDNARTA